MLLPNKLANDFVGKDKNKSLQAAKEILDKPDLEAWQCLIEKSEYLFDYIKEKAGTNLINSINKDNVNNLFQLIKFYSEDWDRFIAEGLCKFKNEDLNNQMLNILKNGTNEEKTYAAKYFACNEYNEASLVLFECSKSSFEPLKINSAQALGYLNEKTSYNYYLEKLKSGDEWEQLDAAQFLSNYGNKDAAIEMLKVVTSSKVSEHISGEAALLLDLQELYPNEDANIQLLALEALDNIISGIPEIWPLSLIFDFKIYENVEKLIYLAHNQSDSDLSGKYAELLLKINSKLALFKENSQYTFDEDKNVLNEIDEIYHLLLSQDDDFWCLQLERLKKELESDNVSRKISALEVIRDYNYNDLVSEIINIISNSNESDSVVYQAIITLKSLDKLDTINNSEDLLCRFKQSSLAALAEDALSTKT